jgi:hypothetical protein
MTFVEPPVAQPSPVLEGRRHLWSHNHLLVAPANADTCNSELHYVNTLDQAPRLASKRATCSCRQLVANSSFY